MNNNANNDYKATILVIDDLLDNLNLLTNLLELKNYDVRVSLSGELALKSLKHFTPDLILLDIKMPNLDGYEVCRRLKADSNTANIPVIFLSALDATLDKVIAFQVGGVDYVTKPFQFDELCSRIESQLTIQKQKQLLIFEIELRKEIEFSLEKINKDLIEKSHQLQLVNQDLKAFNYSVAHDLRNPLSVILGANSLLKSIYNLQLDEKQKKLIDMIDESSRRMEQIIEDLLMLSSLREKELIIDSLHLSKLVTEILAKLPPYQPEKQVELIITPDIIVEGDQRFLRIALENLLGNAWKYSSKQSKPCIEFGAILFKNLPNQQDIFSLQYPNLSFKEIQRKNESHLVYFIRDNGVGFEMEKAAQIFLPFKRLHNQNEFEGTGIGLSIVKRIIDRHHGFIWCESKVNQGTTFYFNLSKKK